MNEITHGHRTIKYSYFNGQVAGEKEEFDKTVFSDQQMILKDIIDHGLALTSSQQTRHLNLDIKIDDKGRYLLTVAWKGL